MKQRLILFVMALAMPAAYAGSYDAVLNVNAGIVCGTGTTLDGALGDLNVKLADQNGVTLSGANGVKLQVRAPFTVSTPVFQNPYGVIPPVGPVAYGKSKATAVPQEGTVIPVMPSFGSSVCVTISSMAATPITPVTAVAP